MKTSRPLSRPAALAIAVLLAGCASSTVTRQAACQGPAYGPVNLLQSMPTEGRFDTCANIVVHRTAFTTPQEVADEIIERAAAAGATHAVILDDENRWSWAEGQIRRTHAVAIRLKQP